MAVADPLWYCVGCGCCLTDENGETSMTCHCGNTILTREKSAGAKKTAKCPS